MGQYALGQPVWRSEDQRLLKGGGRYVDDVRLAGMVHGVVLRSPHAHARIRAIDTSRARAMPGVLDILLHEDWIAAGYGQLPAAKGRKRRDGSDMYTTPIWPLAQDRVRRVGDPVAFIVAETRDQALDAAEAVEVDYETLPAAATTEAAMAPGAPRVWEDCPDNICFVHEAGDKAATEAAFASAAHVVETRFVINRVMAATMEPRGCIGDVDTANDHYTLYTTLQGAHPYRAQLANRILKVPESQVRVIAGDVGGSFGMKSNVYNEGPLCLLASKRVRRPVKWTSTRSESFLSDNHGRDNITEARLALDGEGRFLGLQVRTFAGLGSHATSSTPNPAINNIGTLAGVYRIGAIHVDVTGIFTNANPTSPYRGAGRPEAAFVIERMVDLAADRLGMDPASLRRLNTIAPEEMPFKTALTFTYDSGAFEQNMDMALAMADYQGFPDRRAEARRRGRLRGIGMSNTIERAAGPGFEGAEIRFDRSGTVTLLAGSCTQGQGHETVFKQLVCDALGLDMKDVRYVWGDTDKVAVGHGTGGSRSASIGGSAFRMSCDKILAKATAIAAHLMGVAADEVVFEDGVFSSPKSNRSFTIRDIGKEASNPKSLPEGMEPGLVAQSVFTSRSANYPNGCHVVEVEIDEETGVIEIVGYHVVDDVGTVMNPLLLHGQIHGGVAQGVGQILFENMAYDTESGQLLSGSFMDYAMPRAHHFSDMVVKANPVPTRQNPLGTKGAGEAGAVGAMPALSNAIVDALSSLGIESIPMPATPERIWRMIREARAEGAVAERA